MPPGMRLHEGVWTGCGSCGEGASCPFLSAGAQAVCVVSGCRTGDQERLGRKRAAGRTRQPALRRSDCKRPPDMTRSKPGFRASDRRSPSSETDEPNCKITFRATSVAGGDRRSVRPARRHAPRSPSGGTINHAPFSRSREKVPRECEADEGAARGMTRTHSKSAAQPAASTRAAPLTRHAAHATLSRAAGEGKPAPPVPRVEGC